MKYKNKPILIESTTSSEGTLLTLNIDPETIFFSGHFNHFPILPGVAQIDWAMHFASELLSVPSEFAGMEVIKFQEPIMPDATITLLLNWDEQNGKLQFRYTSERDGQTVSHSSGRIKLVA